MKKTLWLALSALALASVALAQTPAPAPAPTAPAPAAPAKPAAPAAPAKPTVAAPAAPAAPAKPAAPVAAKPASPAAPAAPAAPGAVAAAKAPTSAQAAPPAAAAAAKPATPAKPGPVDWTLDAGHSRIAFVTRHLGFSKVEGHFNKFTATIKADSKTGKISALEATADVASIDTGIEKRDAHLKSDDFFNAAQFPQLKLVLKSITWAGTKFTAKADLTLRDITKPVTLKGELLGVKTVNFGQGPTMRSGYEATTKINRKDFGLKYAAVTEGLAIVGDEVELKLTAELGYTPPAS